MKTLTNVIAFAFVVVCASKSIAATTALDFNIPAPGTIHDTNGLGTGFTHRLPGTGSAIAANDPNMDLQTAPGKLLLTSVQSDFNQFPGPTGANLTQLEAPGLFFAGIGNQDLLVTARFEDVSVPNSSDQLEIYVGVNENKLLRAGVHETNVYIFTENQGSGDLNTATPANAFNTGDDLEISLSRQSGMWTLSWNNLTASTSGSLSAVSLPWLNSETDLYVGVHAANPGTATSFVATIDYFSVTVVPEPTSHALIGAGVLSLLCLKRKR